MAKNKTAFQISINGSLVDVEASQVGTGVVALPAEVFEAAKAKAEAIAIKAAHRESKARVLAAVRFGLTDTITSEEDIATLNHLLERGYISHDLTKHEGGYRLVGWGMYDRAKARFPQIMEDARNAAAK